jgi:hypothetical protein
MSTAIFVVSCDKSRDILTHFSIGFNRYWKDNFLPIFVGSNNYQDLEGFEQAQFIQSPRSNWKTETLLQLNFIKKNDPNISNIILILDDFILNKNVDINRLKSLIVAVEEKKIKYLRLKTLEEGLFFKVTQFFFKTNLVDDEHIFKIRNSHPYYSSLQIAIWDIDHLISLLNSCSDIWDFELQKPDLCEHFSVVNNLLNYKHIVEKGLWESYAEDYCKKYLGFFHKGERGIQVASLFKQSKLLIKRLKFYFFGYLFSEKFRLNK